MSGSRLVSEENLRKVFFQEEDGIRDIGLTGVQTCALPIWVCGGACSMVKVRGLVMGCVAVIGGGAQAAALPAKTAAPVEYVRVCSTHGTGFFYIPGTETCLRIGGRVRAEYLYVEPDDRVDDTIGFRARGQIGRA